MRFVEKDEMKQIAYLFKGWEETLIWSALEGYMGKAWVDKLPEPRTALVITGAFAFFSGDSKTLEAETLVSHLAEESKESCMILVPQNKQWERLIEKVYGKQARPVTRYAIKKEGDIFDRKKLQGLIKKLPEEYTILPVDKRIYKRLMEEDWSRDFCSQFSSFEDYEKRGTGYAVLNDGRVVCGASSYTVYSKGIEIEIDTRKEYRRKGLAAACGAQLILKCLEKGLYPSWDAANRQSVALAQKLGYHFAYEYRAYMIYF